MKKVADILLTIFSVGVICALLAGALAAAAYVVALCIGGEAATALCAWIYKTYFPCVIKSTSVFAGVGLVGMYISKQKALVATAEDIENDEK